MWYGFTMSLQAGDFVYSCTLNTVDSTPLCLSKVVLDFTSHTPLALLSAAL